MGWVTTLVMFLLTRRLTLGVIAVSLGLVALIFVGSTDPVRNPSPISLFPSGNAVIVGMNNGSGLLLDENHVLTAGHVVAAFGVGTPLLTRHSFFQVERVLVGSDWKEGGNLPDVGLYLTTRSIMVPRVKYACRKLQVGEVLYALSSQYFIGERFLSRMTVASDESHVGKGMVLVQSNFWPGMSGSPVFDSSGYLVGVVDDMLGMSLPGLQSNMPIRPIIGFGYGAIAGPDIICPVLKKYLG